MRAASSADWVCTSQNAQSCADLRFFGTVFLLQALCFVGGAPVCPVVVWVALADFFNRWASRVPFAAAPAVSFFVEPSRSTRAVRQCWLLGCGVAKRPRFTDGAALLLLARCRGRHAPRHLRLCFADSEVVQGRAAANDGR